MAQSPARQNVLIYATSNRRHLMPEFMSENLETRVENGEIRPGDTTEEKVSLSERFGLWISFYPFDQDQCLEICAHWLASFGLSAAQIEAARTEALQWSLLRGAQRPRGLAVCARLCGSAESGNVMTSGCPKQSKLNMEPCLWHGELPSPLQTSLRVSVQANACVSRRYAGAKGGWGDGL